MREQELLRQKMSLAYRTGDRAEANRIAKRLEPVEPEDIGKQRAPASGT